MSTPPDDDPYWQSLPLNWYGRTCHLYQNPTGAYKCQVCVMVNRHDFWHWKQGLVQFNTGGYTGAYQIFVGDVSIWKNGSKTQHTLYNATYNVTSGVQIDKSSPWDKDCSNSFNWFGRGYNFRITWLDGTNSGSQTLDSSTIELAC